MGGAHMKLRNKNITNTHKSLLPIYVHMTKYMIRQYIKVEKYIPKW